MPYLENFVKFKIRIFDTYMEIFVPARNSQLTDLNWMRETKARLESNCEVVSSEVVKLHDAIN